MKTAPAAAIAAAPSPTGTAGAAPSGGRGRIRRHWRLYAAISPFYLLFLCFGLVPAGFSLFLAFQRWDGLGDMEYAGLSQFRYLLADTQFWDAVVNTLEIWAMGTLPMLFIALVSAVMLNSAVRFKGVYRFAYFVPSVTSVVAVAVIFGSIFSTSFGLMNAVLRTVGIGEVAWLNEPWGIKVAVAALMTWQWTGYNAIIFLAGLQTIPTELYEAARVDGAGPVRTFFSVTMPMMRPVILFTVVVSTITGLQSFSESQVLLGRNDGMSTFAGGPEHAGQTVVLYFFQQTFDNNDFGYGAAIAWAIFMMVVVFSLINWRLVNRRERARRPS
ncbi:carbohydrate ABC transporter permease [Streptomyces violaceusniger]